MKKMKLIETMVNLEESSLGQEIYTQLINPDGWEKGHWRESRTHAYCLAVDIPGGNPKGVLLQFVDEATTYPLDFRNFIHEAQPASLLDAQFLLEFYRRYYRVETPFRKKGLSALKALQAIHFKPNTLLDGLLGETRGFLMWNFQYEQLLQYVPGGRAYTNDLPMRLGLKSRSLWKSYLQTRIGDDLLKDLIKERSPLKWTTHPRLPSALILWEYLTEVAGE